MVVMAWLASVVLAEPLELKPGMKWKHSQAGMLVWHTKNTVCLHAVAAAILDKECLGQRKKSRCRRFVDHGNYVALLTRADPPWKYWVDKEPSLCSTNGADAVPVTRKSWVCKETCKPQ